MRHTFLSLVIVLSGCAPNQAPTQPAEPQVAVPATQTGASITRLSLRQAQEVLTQRQCTLGGGISTGPGDSWSYDCRNADGLEVALQYEVVDNAMAMNFYREQIPKDSAWKEEGQTLFSVLVTKDDAPLPKEANTLLAALIERAANPEQPFAEVPLPDLNTYPLQTQEVDGFLVIDPQAVALALDVLKAGGFDSPGQPSEQTVDLSNPKDSGFPTLTTSKQRDQESITLRFHCVRQDTEQQFWPSLQEAGLGDAITIHERCRLIVRYRATLQSPADKAISKKWLTAILAGKAKP